MKRGIILVILFLMTQALGMMLGPTNETVRTVVIDPTNPMKINAGTENVGFIRSIEGGNTSTWTSNIDDFKPPQSVAPWIIMSLAIDPDHPEKMFAGTWGGVYKTSDGGETWVEFNGGFGSNSTIVNTLVIDPSNPGTIYAGLGGPIGLRGVYRSINGGSWTPILQNAGENILALAIKPDNSNLILAGTDINGLKITKNGGNNWYHPIGGLPNNKQVHTIGFDPGHPNNIFVGCYGGIYKSEDAGRHWTLVYPSPTTHVYTVVVDPKNPIKVLAGLVGGDIIKSTDGGDTWNIITDLNASIYDLAIDHIKPNKIFAATQNGIYKSTDGGTSWDRVYH